MKRKKEKSLANFNFYDNEQPVLSPQFLSASHRSLIFQRLNLLNTSWQTSPEYQAVLFILTSDDELYAKLGPIEEQ